MDPLTITAIAIGKKAFGWLKTNFIPVVVVVFVLAAAGGVAWLFDDWKDRGRELDAYRSTRAEMEKKVKAAERAREAAVDEKKTAEAERDTAKKAVEICNKATAKYKTDADARVARLETALSERPPIIEDYREAATSAAELTESSSEDPALDSARLLAEADPPS